MEELNEWESIDHDAVSGLKTGTNDVISAQSSKDPQEEKPPAPTKFSKKSESVQNDVQWHFNKEKTRENIERSREVYFAQKFSSLDLGPSNAAITPTSNQPSSNCLPSDSDRIIKSIGYSSNPSSLPHSLRMAISNRFTHDQLSKFKEEAELNFSHPLPYFFSGSFMFPACLRAVTNGTTLASVASCMTPAVLRGYNRYAVNGQPWPAMLPSTNVEDSVWGLLVFGMLESQRKAIHRFENNMFDLRRTKVEVELEGGGKVIIDAGVYVWNQSPDRLIQKEDREWKVEDLMGSAWFNSIVKRAEDEEKLLEGGSSVGF
ncbi:uncharacterized protein BDR25DRAFT_306558 [Lindgomyces ingoldianus]|uniref:Uncharacterized protein n=1 Tax=Lindgomyces ingoldianus TaxID=673940 RepID=A0ACB6QGY4_9PLEO|nr:uncharacterized protein BDR25DRAFT_306558 [Lindgomyces ingoldianus]KAF2465818.1 hypothetical protein BDR25DRAFT_306558 [Lindgomyces ingoldianus]